MAISADHGLRRVYPDSCRRPFPRVRIEDFSSIATKHSISPWDAGGRSSPSSMVELYSRGGFEEHMPLGLQNSLDCITRLW